MKIIRDGKEIELTSNELYLAYEKQQHLFDVENIEDNMSNYLNEKQYGKYKNNREFIDFAAYELNRNEDYGMSYDQALYDAFTITIKRFEKK